MHTRLGSLWLITTETCRAAMGHHHCDMQSCYGSTRRVRSPQLKLVIIMTWNGCRSGHRTCLPQLRLTTTGYGIYSCYKSGHRYRARLPQLGLISAVTHIANTSRVTTRLIIAVPHRPSTSQVTRSIINQAHKINTSQVTTQLTIAVTNRTSTSQVSR